MDFHGEGGSMSHSNLIDYIQNNLQKGDQTIKKYLEKYFKRFYSFIKNSTFGKL